MKNFAKLSNEFFNNLPKSEITKEDVINTLSILIGNKSKEAKEKYQSAIELVLNKTKGVLITDAFKHGVISQVLLDAKFDFVQFKDLFQDEQTRAVVLSFLQFGLSEVKSFFADDLFVNWFLKHHYPSMTKTQITSLSEMVTHVESFEVVENKEAIPADDESEYEGPENTVMFIIRILGTKMRVSIRYAQGPLLKTKQKGVEVMTKGHCITCVRSAQVNSYKLIGSSRVANTLICVFGDPYN